MKQSASTMLSAVASIFIAQEALALPQPYAVCCGGQPIRWNSSSYDVPIRFSMDGTNPLRAAFAAAVSSWNDLVGSEFDFILDPVAGPNEPGMNNAYFDAGSNPNGILAQTIFAFNICGTNGFCCQVSPCAASSIVETDIIFYLKDANGSVWPWSSSLPPNITNTSLLPIAKYFAIVAAHELGHAAGLLDLVNPPNPQARMNAYPNGGWGHAAISDLSSGYERLRPKAYDQANIRAIYPQTGSGFRIYASNIQPGSVPVEGQVLSFNAATSNQSYYPSPGVAFPGTTVTIQTCYGNAGNAAYSATIPFKVYLSSNNDKIDTGDTEATTSYSFPSGLPAGAYGCAPISFTVPNVPSGEYNIIYALDIGVGTTAKQQMVVNRRLTVQ